jgi:hypothetical protein
MQAFKVYRYMPYGLGDIDSYPDCSSFVWHFSCFGIDFPRDSLPQDKVGSVGVPFERQEKVENKNKSDIEPGCCRCNNNNIFSWTYNECHVWDALCVATYGNK